MRTKARLDHEIKRDIEQLKVTARPGITHIHLIPCDFARVKHDPKYFGATMWSNDHIMTPINGRLVEVVPLT